MKEPTDFYEVPWWILSQKDDGDDPMEWWSVREREMEVCVCVFLCE